MARVERLLSPLWPLVQPPGGRIGRARFAWYAVLMRAHHWLWVRGIEV
jgi:hypothetical protein